MTSCRMMNDHDEETVATILAMRRQEERSYACKAYYSQANSPLNPLVVAPTCLAGEAVTAQTRTVLCDWTVKIIDFCRLDRETAEIAMSYVDRYVLTEDGREIMNQSDKFQLLVVTSLYVAIKVIETVAISSKQFEKISRNTFTAKDVEAMERKLLDGLNWNLYPPTSLAFVRHYLDLIPSSAMDQEMKATAFVLSKLQTELAIRDCPLVSVRASTIAFASLMNSFDALGMTDSASGRFTVHCFVSKVASLGLANKAFFEDESILLPIQNQLYHAIAKQSNISMYMEPAGVVTPPASPKQSRPPVTGKSYENTPRSIIGRTL